MRNVWFHRCSAWDTDAHGSILLLSHPICSVAGGLHHLRTLYWKEQGNEVSRVTFVLLFLPSGAIAPTFVAGSGPDYLIAACGTQSDGRIIIIGNFTDYDGNAAIGIARIHNDLTANLTASYAESPFGLHPDPASQSCTIVGNRSNKPLAVTLSDIQGRVVRSMSTSKHIGIADLSSGLYVAQIAEGEDRSTIKLIVD